MRRAAPRALATVLFALGVAATTSLATGCDERTQQSASAEPAPRGPASSEAVSVRMGGRNVRVRCMLGCEDVTREMTRLSMDCELDPLSTPHHVSERPALIHLACCEEAQSAYAQGCGVEALEACVSRWSAHCSSSR